MRRSVRTGVLALGVVSAGCITMTPAFEAPGPAEVSRLETLVSQGSNDVEALVALATARLLDGDAADAIPLLEQARTLAPEDAAVTLLRGVALEEVGRVLDAANQYRSFIDLHPGPMALHAEDRLDGVASGATQEMARRVLATSAPELDRERVVIIPFSHGGTPAEEALVAAVTTLATHDIASRGWSVVSPDLAQALLVEEGIDIADRGSAQVARRMADALGAGHVVRGRLLPTASDQSEWRLDVDDFTRQDSTTIATVGILLATDQMIELEQRIVGILSTALFRTDADAHEDVVHTVNRFALLEYGRGLSSWRAGDFDGTVAAMESALEMDPDFQEAAALVTRAQRVTAQRSSSRSDGLVEIARFGELRRVLTAAMVDPAGPVSGNLSATGRSSRSFVADLLGLDRVGLGSTLELTFTVPRGMP